MDFYNSPSVSRIMGITLRQLRHWVDSGIIDPARVEETGEQKRYLFDFRSLLEIRLVLSLKQRSLSLDQIRRAMEVFARNLKAADSIHQLTFVSDGESFYALSREAREIFAELRQGKTLFALPVDEMALELARKLDLEEKEVPALIFREKRDSSYVLIKFKF